jgi:hypothetical protein
LTIYQFGVVSGSCVLKEKVVGVFVTCFENIVTSACLTVDMVEKIVFHK